MGDSLWNSPAPVKPKVTENSRDIALRTCELLRQQGWCLWKCQALDGELIVVIRDEEAVGYPEGHAVYTERELHELLDADDATLKLIHVAKNLTGAQLESKS